MNIGAVNNGVDDCGDGSDEPMMQTDGKTFSCDDGAVVSFERVNDGEVDCPDGSDEVSFIGDYWNCANGEMIYSMYINNGRADCADGSDEPHYDMTPYEVSTYACEDGNTVLLSKVNDGNDDCPDGTDEDPSGTPEWLHEDFMYLKETSLSDRREHIEKLKKQFTSKNAINEPELLYEDQDMMAFRHFVVQDNGTRHRVTQIQLYKSGKVWRELSNAIEEDPT